MNAALARSDLRPDDALTGETLRRAIIRAYMADELTVEEIAAEFSCSRQYVTRICTPIRETRCKVRRRRANAPG